MPDQKLKSPILSVFLKDVVIGYKSLHWQFFQHLKDGSLFSNLMIFYERLVITQSIVPYMKCIIFFCPATYKIFKKIFGFLKSEYDLYKFDFLLFYLV